MEYLKSKLFLSEKGDIPVIDVRSPKEYEKGHIPGAKNIPLFTDREREQIGTIYKQTGKIQAIEKGLEYVGPKMKFFTDNARLLARESKLKIYCWRGGMRSEKMAWLFELIGIQCFVLKGGYKSYRKRILKDFKKDYPLIVLQGATGSGKTSILEKMSEIGEQVIDLEGIANHRGSAFGHIGMDEQPTSQQFQNNIHTHLFNLKKNKRIWVEGESLSIGKVYLPETLWEKMNHSPVVQIVLSQDIRIQRLVEEYGKFDKEKLVEATKKIIKKFGGDKVKSVIHYLEEDNLIEAARLLLDYYDRSYSYSQEKYKSNPPYKVVCNSGIPEENIPVILEKADEII